MGLDTSLKFMVGVPVSKLCPKGSPSPRKTKKIKFDQDTGKPYEIELFKHYAGLANGQEIELGERCSTNALVEYFEKLGFECGGYYDNFFNGVVGFKIGESLSVDGAQTMSLPAPSDEEVKAAIQKVKELFQTTTFPEETFRGAGLIAIMDASY